MAPERFRAIIASAPQGEPGAGTRATTTAKARARSAQRLEEQEAIPDPNINKGVSDPPADPPDAGSADAAPGEAVKLDEDEAFVITPPTAEGQVAVFGSLSNDSMKLLPPDHPDARRWDACIAVLKGDARTGERKLYWEAQIAGRLQHPRCRREGSREPKNQSAQGIQNCSLKG